MASTVMKNLSASAASFVPAPPPVAGPSSPPTTPAPHPRPGKAARTALRSAIRPHRPFIPICTYSTRTTCPAGSSCLSTHYVKALRPHTEEKLGDCSYLNTCHRMDSCRYVHWRLEDPHPGREGKRGKEAQSRATEEDRGDERVEEDVLPPQWINADLRTLDVSVLGKFSVIVADPPWAIHQELPYGTLTDDEMMQMPVGSMQDEGGVLFLWVTGRAMELGRECLDAWGYERIDELCWIKTNQLQGLIRTGRTGHWLNHSKEHCLVALRRSSTSPHLIPSLPAYFNKGLDTQVLQAEVRETSRKPDELYEMIERVLGGRGRSKGRKVELFGREHNLRDGWLTLGNQFATSDQVFEKDIVNNFTLKYPERGMKLLNPRDFTAATKLPTQ